MKFEMDISAVSILGGASVNTKSLGTWTAGLNTNISITQTSEMRNLTAAVVYRIYTVVQAPFIIKDSESTKGYKGYCIDLINEVAKKVGFDYEIKEVEDGKFGSLNEKVIDFLIELLSKTVNCRFFYYIYFANNIKCVFFRENYPKSLSLHH